MRKNYFVNEETGFFIKQQKRQASVKMPMNGLYFISLNRSFKNLTKVDFMAF
jgi:hypothetical protein